MQVSTVGDLPPFVVDILTKLKPVILVIAGYVDQRRDLEFAQDEVLGNQARADVAGEDQQVAVRHRA